VFLAAQLAQRIYPQVLKAAQDGITLISNNQYGLTPSEVVTAFDTYADGGFAGFWSKGAELVDFVNAIVPNSVQPLTNPSSTASTMTSATSGTQG
jgi:hypothetical protein